MMFSQSDDVTLLKWEENVTLKNLTSFKEAIQQLIESNATKLLLNLKNVQYVNSAALGIIADSVMNARKNQKELILVEIQQPVKEIFNIVKFNSFIKLFDTEKEGCQYFKCDQHG